jgi:1,2-diacylglycerol 3-alpha-glucosyltransferase
MSPSQRRVVFFTPGAVGPYHIAQFSKLAEIYENLLIVNIPTNGKYRPWPHDPKNLADKIVIIEGSAKAKNLKRNIRSVIEILEQKQPEAVVLAGYNDLSQIAAARWAQKNRVARIVHADSWYADRPRYRLREWIKKYFFVRSHFDFAFVPGILAYQYMRSLGIPEKAIWRGMYVVDNAYFTQASSLARRQGEVMREKFDLPPNYFLTVARFAPEKNLVRLLQAFNQYSERGGTWNLVLIGAGPLEDQLKNLASHLGNSGILIIGWQQYEELPIFYGLANCFVLPSLSEPWGIVVNEAMACGLPVIVSRNCGCFPELCHRGVNGFDFDPFDVAGLAHLMSRVSNRSVDLEAMGTASLSIINNYSLDTWVKALHDCIETAVYLCQRN